MSEYKIVWEDCEYVIRDSNNKILKNGFRFPIYAIEYLYANYMIGHEEYENFLKEFGYAD